MAIGEVTDFGAMVIRIICSAPKAQASATPSSVATTPPISRVSRVGHSS